jgi:formate/nitrite transporter FocA (FNT family)
MAQGSVFSMDALLPSAMAEKAEEVGVKKAAMDATCLFALAVLAGAFIALGAVFSVDQNRSARKLACVPAS